MHDPCIHTCTYIHTYIHTNIHTHTILIHRSYANARSVHTYIHIYIHTYIHTYIIHNTYIHTYIHTSTCGSHATARSMHFYETNKCNIGCVYMD